MGIPSRKKAVTLEVESDHDVASVVGVLCEQLGLGDSSGWNLVVDGSKIDSTKTIGGISLRDSRLLELIPESTAASSIHEKNPFLAKPLCTCGKKLTWVSRYERFFCYPCKKYPPTCPSCKKDLFWVPEYSRYYCNFCGSYALYGTLTT